MRASAKVPIYLHWSCVLTLALGWLGGAPLCAQSGTASAADAAGAHAVEYSVPAGTILRMTLAGPLKLSRLQPGSELDGELMHPVYVVDRKVIPAGSHIRAVVDKVDKERAANKKGFVEQLDTVRSFGLNRKYDYHVDFRSASLSLSDGSSMPLHLAFIDAGQVMELHAKGGQIQVGEKSGSALAKAAPGVGQIEGMKEKRKQLEQYRHPIMTLQLKDPVSLTLAAPEASAPAVASNQPLVLPAGTQARLLLLTRLSASDSHAGDLFQARLEEPISVEHQVTLPEGTLFEGSVRKIVRPRRLSRPGSLYINFDKVTLPDGSAQKVAASLAAADVGKKSSINMDAEGGLHGKGRGAKQTMVQLGLSLVANQAADEIVELATHAVAPYAGAGTGLALFFARHGKDVVLPQYSELQVVFDRAVTVPAGAPKAAEK